MPYTWRSIISLVPGGYAVPNRILAAPNGGALPKRHRRARRIAQAKRRGAVAHRPGGARASRRGIGAFYRRMPEMHGVNRRVYRRRNARGASCCIFLGAKIETRVIAH